MQPVLATNRSQRYKHRAPSRLLAMTSGYVTINTPSGNACISVNTAPMEPILGSYYRLDMGYHMGCTYLYSVCTLGSTFAQYSSKVVQCQC